jgi:hypothetical protein
LHGAVNTHPFAWRSKHTPLAAVKTNQLMTYRKIIIFSRSIQNTLIHYGQNVEILVVKLGGTQRNILFLKSQILVVFLFAINKCKKL